MASEKADTVVEATPRRSYFWANANLSVSGILDGRYPCDCNVNFASPHGTITAIYGYGSIGHSERHGYGQPPSTYEQYGLLYGIGFGKKHVSLLISSGVSIVKLDHWFKIKDTTEVTSLQTFTYGIYEERKYTAIGFPSHAMVLYHRKYLGVSIGMNVMYNKDISFTFPCIGIVAGRFR